mmetsp:Transcript_61389/g.162512  ORF Transcript_61389/g.162512 Transcript_61389/m.162512 type:complete len:255 (-) Transcript_61389:897-1661(-)
MQRPSVAVWCACHIHAKTSNPPQPHLLRAASQDARVALLLPSPALLAPLHPPSAAPPRSSGSAPPRSSGSALTPQPSLLNVVVVLLLLLLALRRHLLGLGQLLEQLEVELARRLEHHPPHRRHLVLVVVGRLLGESELHLLEDGEPVVADRRQGLVVLAASHQALADRLEDGDGEEEHIEGRWQAVEGGVLVLEGGALVLVDGGGGLAHGGVGVGEHGDQQVEHHEHGDSKPEDEDGVGEDPITAVECIELEGT